MDEDQVHSLARRNHERYVERHPDGRAASPWEELTAIDRESNVASARFAEVLLAALGLRAVPRGAGVRRSALTEEEVEAGARLEHLRWCRFTRACGRDDHADLVTWADLDEATRELDRIRVRSLPTDLAAVGLDVVPIPIPPAPTDSA